MPTNVTHSFDREPAVYAPGEVIRLTVAVEVDDPAPVTGTVVTETVVILPDGTRSEPVTHEAEYMVDEHPGVATTEVVADTANRTWTRSASQDNGAVFTTVA